MGDLTLDEGAVTRRLLAAAEEGLIDEPCRTWFHHLVPNRTRGRKYREKLFTLLDSPGCFASSASLPGKDLRDEVIIAHVFGSAGSGSAVVLSEDGDSDGRVVAAPELLGVLDRVRHSGWVTLVIASSQRRGYFSGESSGAETLLKW
jgi:hypothetical protein